MHRFTFPFPAGPGCRQWLARRRSRAVAALLWSIALLPGLAAGQQPLSLAEAVRLAVARSPAIASQQSMAAAAREMSVAAGELPDPKLIGGFENVPTTGADALDASIATP